MTSTSKEREHALTCRYGCMALRQASGMFSLLKCIKESRNVSTLAIITFAAFQLRSFGTLPPGAIRTMTAAVTLVTATTGEPKDFSSVRLFWMTGEESAVKWMLRGGECWRASLSGEGRWISRKKEEPVPTLRRQQRILIRASLESSEQRLNRQFCLFEQRAPFKRTGCF